jgi:hypothetical protein
MAGEPIWRELAMLPFLEVISDSDPELADWKHQPQRRATPEDLASRVGLLLPKAAEVSITARASWRSNQPRLARASPVTSTRGPRNFGWAPVRTSPNALVRAMTSRMLAFVPLLP